MDSTARIMDAKSNSDLNRVHKEIISQQIRIPRVSTYKAARINGIRDT
jgi:hypothetical protein